MNYLVKYNLYWPKKYSFIVSYLELFIPKECFVYHIGSTSVPGMPAKDIIDLNIEYTPRSMEKLIQSIEAAGYEHQGDLGIHGRAAFQPLANSVAADLPAHHLYACEKGAQELLKHLAFRDYLKSHPLRAEWLATQKLFADASAKSRSDYIEKKAESYTLITEEAMKWVSQ